MDKGFYLGVMKCFGIRWRWWLYTVAKVLNATVDFNFMLCEFHFNKENTLSEPACESDITDIEFFTFVVHQ